MIESPNTLVREFHHAFGLSANDRPTRVPTELADVRTRLHTEENAELAAAIHGGDLAEIAQELADVVYIAYGTALSYGIDLDAAIAEVHRANMTKLDDAGKPIMIDGKVSKGPNYRPPQIRAIVQDDSSG